MKKIFTGLSIVMLSIFTFALVTPAQAATNWDVSGTYVWDVFGTYFHDITLTQDAGGVITGTAGYPSGESPYTDPGQTTEVITGLVTGDNISFTTTYDGPYAPGSVTNVSGTIAPNGHISGTAPWEWQFTGGVANNDADNDGVLNGSDVCAGTDADGSWSVSWGNNRWQVQEESDGDLVWYQNKVGKKGITTPTAGESISYTYGCNGHQILAMLNATYGSVMNGHLKYGLSSSVLKEFALDMNDGVMDGQYYLETVTVPASSAVAIPGTINLLSGHDYAFKASGTANAGDGIQFDADYSYRTPTSATWTDDVNAYESYGPTLLDLKVNGGFVNWDNDATYNADHTYWYEAAGTGVPANFQVYDVYYPGNTGNLTVDIYAVI